MLWKNQQWKTRRAQPLNFCGQQNCCSLLISNVRDSFLIRQTAKCWEINIALFMHVQIYEGWYYYVESGNLIRICYLTSVINNITFSFLRIQFWYQNMLYWLHNVHITMGSTNFTITIDFKVKWLCNWTQSTNGKGKWFLLTKKSILNFKRLMGIHWLESTFCGRHMCGRG